MSLGVELPPVSVAPDRSQPAAAWLEWTFPVFALALWALVIRHLAPEWGFSEQYEYGWLVPLLTAYLVKVRAERCPALDPAPPRWRMSALLLSAAISSVLLMPVREANADWRLLGWVLALQASAVTFLLLWQIGGLRWVRHFQIPVLFFFTAVPLSREIEAHGMQWLMQHNARVAVELLHWLGVSAEARGNLIALPSGTLGVDEACSGVRSLLGTVMLSLFLGEILALTRTRRLILLFIGIALAMSTNVARTMTLALIADSKGLAAMEHWHDTAGYAVLAICWCSVVFFSWLLHRPASGAHASKSATPIDSAEIFRRMRSVAWPAGASLFLLGLGLFSTELWFRKHERSVTSLAAWTFRMPSQDRYFRTAEISKRVREDLRFDYGNSAQWQDERNWRWQALYFRWLPGRNAVQTVIVHDPRVCLAAIGMEPVADLPPVIIERGDIRLPFEAYRFRDRTTDVYVFNCVAEDVRRGPAQNAILENNTRSSRIAATLAGKRQLGQRRLEIAVWGAPNQQAAEAQFRRLLDAQLIVEAPGLAQK